MKTVYIIAMAVGCSVVAVFGILFGLEYQAQEYRQALALEVRDCFNRYKLSPATSDCLDSIIDRYDIDLSPEYYISEYDTPEQEVIFELPKTYEGIKHRLAELEKQIEMSKKMMESSNP